MTDLSPIVYAIVSLTFAVFWHAGPRPPTAEGVFWGVASVVLALTAIVGVF